MGPRSDQKKSENPLRILKDFYKKHSPKPIGTMSEYFQWVLSQAKNETVVSSAGKIIEDLLSVNNEMIGFMYMLKRIMSAAGQKTTEKLISFYKSEVPNEWVSKKMVFDTLSAEKITEEKIGSMLLAREAVTHRNCMTAVIAYSSHDNILIAKVFVNMIENHGWECAFDNIYPKFVALSLDEKARYLKKQALIITALEMRELAAKPSTKGMFACARPLVPASDVKVSAATRESCAKPSH